MIPSCWLAKGTEMAMFSCVCPKKRCAGQYSSLYLLSTLSHPHLHPFHTGPGSGKCSPMYPVAQLRNLSSFFFFCLSPPRSSQPPSPAHFASYTFSHPSFLSVSAVSASLQMVISTFCLCLLVDPWSNTAEIIPLVSTTKKMKVKFFRLFKGLSVIFHSSHLYLTLWNLPNFGYLHIARYYVTLCCHYTVPSNTFTTLSQLSLLAKKPS